MITGLIVYKRLAKYESTYLKRLITGLLVYVLTTECFTVNAVITGKLSGDATWLDKIFAHLILIGFGLILSSLLALLFKQKPLED